MSGPIPQGGDTNPAADEQQCWCTAGVPVIGCPQHWPAPGAVAP